MTENLENRITEVVRYLEEQRRVLAIETNDLKKPTRGVISGGVVSEDGRSIDKDHPLVVRANLEFAGRLLKASVSENDQDTVNLYARVNAAIERVGTMRSMEFIQHERESMDAPDTSDDGDYINLEELERS